MVEHEQAYRAFIQSRGVGANDRVASSLDSYVSYLWSVSAILHQDITPDSLRSEHDITDIVSRLLGERADKTIENYRAAMRQYVAFVEEKGL